MGLLDVHNACKIVLLTPGNEANPVELNKLNYNQLAAGGASDLTGGAGMVMKQVPKFYYKYSYATGVHSWQISLDPFVGSEPHPWFYKEGQWVNFRYIAIYPAAGYDVSVGSYVDGNGSNSWFNTSEDKLGSIVGKKPLTYKTRAQFRAAAARVGTGWSVLDFWGYAALKLLYITRYGDLDSQSLLGQGNTRWPSWDFATQIGATGKVLSINAPGQSTSGGNINDYVNLDGLEDVFGGIWEFIDGWNVNERQSYYCQNPTQFADDTITNYTSIGAAMPSSSGWQNTLQQNIAMLPGSIGATSTTKITDYYWQNTGWRVARVGGSAAFGANAGLFALRVSTASSYASSSIGARLCF